MTLWSHSEGAHGWRVRVYERTPGGPLYISAADPLLAGAVHVHHRRGTGEVPELAIVRGQLVALDPDRELGEAVVGGAHGGSD